MVEDRTNRYAELLADIDAQIAELQTARAAIEKISGLPGASGGIAPITRAGEPVVSGDMFFRAKLADAAKRYLAMAKKPQSAAEIAEALERGGYVHQSNNFSNTVWTGLDRAEQKTGEIVKVGKKWGLAEWYPGRSRKKAKGQQDVAEAAEDAGATETEVS